LKAIGSDLSAASPLELNRMEATKNPLFRPDTLLGVCQALGEDLGINPLWLRVPLASAILFNPVGAVGAYLFLGLLVLVSRVVFPPKLVAVEVPAEQPAPVARHEAVEQDTRELAEAA
jgi:phage shock protein PspC (stress-responsive transcriptional regulator)